MSSFESLSLAEPLLRALAEADHHTPTPIQLQAIPAALVGRDVMGCAQTGTGKTGAFTLPLLHKLLLDPAAPVNPKQADDSHGGAPRGHGRGGRVKRQGGRAHRSRGGGAFQAKPRALVLSPTRELAAQIGDSVEMYGRFTGLRHAIIFGGVHQSRQTRDFAGGVDVLIATPGRLEDLVQQRLVDLSQVQVLVLDEADRMLDMGFVVPVKRIADQTRSDRQTMLFSATMPRGVEKLAREVMTDPERIAVDPVSSAVDTIEQQVYMVDRNRKQELLENLLRDEAIERAVVFTRTKYGADRVGKRLERGGMVAGILHGDRNQNQRTRALEAFRRGHSRVLVATDVAARGLDVDGITHVFNFDLPMDPESYVHRIGRTGRAGNEGVAIAFCDRSERGTLRSIERLTGTRINVMREVPLARVDDRGVVAGTTKRRESAAKEASDAADAKVLTASDGEMITIEKPARRSRPEDGPDPRTRKRIVRRSKPLVAASGANPPAAEVEVETFDRPADRPHRDRDNGGFRGKPGGARPYGNRDDRDNGGFRGKPGGSRPYGNRDDRDNGGFRGKPGGARPYGNRDDRDNGGFRGKPGGARPYGNRDDRDNGGFRGKPGGARPYGNRDDRDNGGFRGKPGGGRPYGNRDDRDNGGFRGKPGGARPYGNRDDRDNGGFRGKPGGGRPYGDRDNRGGGGGYRGKPAGDRPYGDRDNRGGGGGYRGKAAGDRPYGDRDNRGGGGGYRGKPGGGRPYGNRDDRGGGGGYRGKPSGDRPYGDRDNRGGGGGYRGKPSGDRPYGDRDNRGGGGGYRGKPSGDRPYGDRDNRGGGGGYRGKPSGDRPYGDRDNRGGGGGGYRGKPSGGRPYGDRDNRGGGGGYRGKPSGDRPYGDRDNRGGGGVYRGKPRGDRPYGDRDNRGGGGGYRGKPSGGRPYGDRDNRGGGGGYRGKPSGDRPYGNRDDRGGGGGYRGKPSGDRPYGDRDSRGGGGGGYRGKPSGGRRTAGGANPRRGQAGPRAQGDRHPNKTRSRRPDVDTS